MTDQVPKRVQLRRAKGWKMPANTVKIDRTTKWGNPFVVTPEISREQSIDFFKRMMAGQPAKGLALSEAEQQEKRALILAHIDELRGRNLACWCSLDGACHGDVLLEFANAKEAS